MQRGREFEPIIIKEESTTNKVEEEPIVEAIISPLTGLAEKYKLSDACDQLNKIDPATEWRAHPNLRIERSGEYIVISEEVIKDYNEIVVESAKTSGKEIPFYFIFDEKRKTIKKLFVGKPQQYGAVSWDEIGCKTKDGETLNLWKVKHESELHYKGGRYSIGMGHTHPKGYGPIFSDVKGRWTEYGTDYESARIKHIQPSPFFNSYNDLHWVGAPLTREIGLIEAKERGRIIFHPVQVEERTAHHM